MKFLRNCSIFVSKKYLNLNNSLEKSPKTIRMLSANNYWPQPEEDMNNRPKIYSKVHPFRNLYEWKSMKEFVEMLAQNIVYNDSNLIAISKPWGVGIHRPEVMITNKNSHLLLGVYSGCAKYCVNDSLELLSQLLNVKKLKCVKTIDRFMSGIILLVTNESTEKKVIKAINRCKPMEIPFMKFWCITKGWPVINAPFLRERVGIKLLEIDELGEHKESIIIPSEQLTNSMRRRQKPQSDGLIVKTVLSEMRTIEINKCLSTALVELSTTSLKWNFIPCYLANRAAFVLGDVRFSRRVKHVLGSPMSLNPQKLNFKEDFEPLSSNICRQLLVKGNAYVPLMIHHKSLTLPKYLGQNDLIIDTNIAPNHFTWALDRLGIKIPVNKQLTTH